MYELKGETLYKFIHVYFHKTRYMMYIVNDGLPGFIIIGDIISGQDWEDFLKFIK